ncbi:MAG TPA: DUF5615 family PIN-like protein [Nostocaceae cyanobacterium]|nr:DUF5615 family PIN-like protein [Nostocaceae cyanobacterium]
MSLRFFIDQCVPNSVTKILHDSGYAVFILKDYLPIESPDNIVINKAQELNAILVSVNGDFADIVTYQPSNYKGIISLQLRNHPEILTQLMTRLKEYLASNNSMDYYQGKLFLVEVYRIRVRE